MRHILYKGQHVRFELNTQWNRKQQNKTVLLIHCVARVQHLLILFFTRVQFEIVVSLMYT